MGLRIAERWFEFETLTDGIIHIWEPHVIRVAQCNIWHVRGRDRDLLIDTGMGTNTGGRIKRLERSLGAETFMVTYGDGVSDIDLHDLLAFHRSHGKLATLKPP